MSDTQRPITASLTDSSVAGHWRIVAYPPGAAPVDITLFRGTPTQVGEHSFTDPYGPAALTLTLPQVTIFEHLGVGDLSWVRPHTDIDLTWVGDLPATYPFGAYNGTTWTPSYAWEGYITSFAFTSDPGGSNLVIQAKGAMLQLDNYVAKPEYPTQPLPYEWAIARQFTKPGLRLAPLKVTWPSWWSTVYSPPARSTPSYLVPVGVTAGRPWTSLLTRSTGSWDATLTSYIASLLAAMYSERGRWTLDLGTGRQPQLLHRDFSTTLDEATVVLDPTAPGVSISLTQDWEQSLTTVYGQGKSLEGVAYSGMNVSNDGSRTSYTPLAFNRQVYPTTGDNAWLDPTIMPREVNLQLQPGLNEDDAQTVARAHLTRFSDPGVTGTITLATDPTLAGAPLPRHLVRAGMKLAIPGLFGRTQPLIVHVSASNHNLATGSTTLTIDSKYRDALTVDEVRLRGRDSLSISRMLIGGKYQAPIPDQLYPWSYAAGSGYIPSNPLKDARKVFNGIPDNIPFPWVDWTRTHPPSDPRYNSGYIHIPPAQPNADLNWALQHNPRGNNRGTPIRMAQAGDIRLFQLAAYDRDGNILPVPFHISFYYIADVGVPGMPKIPADQAHLFPPYKAAQHYPYVRDGWENLTAAGTLNNPWVPQPIASLSPVTGPYGTFYDKAGYWPGSYAAGDPPTGLLVDESGFHFDTSSIAQANFNPYSRDANLANNMAGQIYAMLYCDAQGTQDVYFLGRMFRKEPDGEGT